MLLVIALAMPAHAQAPTTPSAADEAFREGRELLKAGKYAAACEQFNKSQQLDPQLGTLFNIAACSEQIGRLATAAAAYRELLAKDTNPNRKATASGRLAVVEPRVPKLIIKVDKPPPGLTVSLDSKAGPRDVQANQPVEVDFADYTIVVRARGYSEFISKVKVSEERKTTTIDATLVPGTSNTAAALETGEVDTDDKPRSRRKLYAIGAVGVGGAAVVTGVVFGVLARSKWNDAKAVCGGIECTTQEDLDHANVLGDQARSKATLSTILVLGGAVVGGVGVALWVTAPGETQVTAHVGSGGGTVVLGGRF